MMNKKLGIGVLSAAIALGTMGTVTAATTNNSSNSNSATATTSKLIGETKAKQIALTKVPGGTIDGVDLERYNNGKMYYEVDVDKANSTKDVDVHIDAVTGTVLKVVNDDNDDDDNDNQTATNNANNKVKTVAQAKTIALKAVKGTVTKVDRDSDDGRVTYEVDLKIAGGEATVEIDAATGKVLSVDKDYENDDDNDDYDND